MGDDRLSLDLMRRDRASDNGLFEFIVSGLMRDTATLGVSRVSLTFTVFEEGARIGAAMARICRTDVPVLVRVELVRRVDCRSHDAGEFRLRDESGWSWVRDGGLASAWIGRRSGATFFSWVASLLLRR